MIATKDITRPKIVWIWHKSSPLPHAVISLRESIRQLLWHPSLPHVLLIITSHKDPIIYAWHDPTKAPAVGYASLKSHGKFEGSWLPNRFAERHLFMLSSPEAFEVGFLEHNEGQVLFDSILRRDSFLDDQSELSEDSHPTPTRSERRVKISVPNNLTTDKDDVIHLGAKGMNW